MSNYQLLNNVDHKNTKVITDNSEKFGDKVSVVQTFPSEFMQIQKHYPILFQKNAQQTAWQVIAMLGLVENENLFLDEDSGWNANYIPAMVAKGPFLIGFQDQSSTGGDAKTPVIHIDVDSPRVNAKHGQPVFTSNGSTTPYIAHINDVLTGIMDGVASSGMFFEALEKFDLIEEAKIAFTLNNGEKYNIAGNYTINEEKLAKLDGAAIKELQNSGVLMGIYLVIASMSNIQRLVNIKNMRLSTR